MLCAFGERVSSMGILGMMMRVVGIVLVSVMAFTASAQQSPDGVWNLVPTDSAKALAKSGRETWITPQNFSSVTLNISALQGKLNAAPAEALLPVRMSEATITLPMPDGSFARFAYVESPIMSPELQAKFPEIRTYLGQGIDDPAARVRFDFTPAGFHAQILSPNGAVYIDPYFRDGSLYASYAKAGYTRDDVWMPCFVEESNDDDTVASSPKASLGTELRTYRLAVACTGEYAAFHGGTVPLALAGIVTTVNRVSGVYEDEFAVRFQLIANNDAIVFLDGATDNLNNDDAGVLIDQSQVVIDDAIGSANYDVGHTFSTGAGGLASLGVICFEDSKARGVTGRANPIGDPYDIDYVAHELGHQFGADHTFNGIDGSCAGNRVANHAVEPGSGTTIMAYAGICGSDNTQQSSDPIFHAISFDDIRDHITGGSGNNCGTKTATGNNIPVITAGAANFLPINTPFLLDSTATDADGDTLTYLWEQMDASPFGSALNAPDDGSIPLFRSFTPTTNSFRVFPRLSDVINNTEDVSEKYPQTDRTMHMRVTVRDNRAGGGGVNSDNVILFVTSAAGPFRVVSPNGSETTSGITTVTWNVASTIDAPVNCTHVKISVSTDGGLTYPTVVAASTANDGSEDVAMPNTTSSTARIKIEAVDNYFFDISNANFSIEPSGPPPAPVVTTNGGADFTVGITPFTIQGTTSLTTDTMELNGTPSSYTPGSQNWSVDATLEPKASLSFTALNSSAEESLATTINVTYDPASDLDNDGILDSVETAGDADADSTPNYLDTDSDDNGILDETEGVADRDGDSLKDFVDPDNDNDGVLDATEIQFGTDPNRLAALVQFNVTDTQIDLGEAIAITGTLDTLPTAQLGALEGKEIVVRFALQATETTRVATIDANNAFDLNFVPDAAGSWFVSTRFAGDANLESTSFSQAVVVTVNQAQLPTDINGDDAVDAVDVQLVINSALGFDIAPFDGDVNNDESVDAQDVQLEINAALGL